MKKFIITLLIMLIFPVVSFAKPAQTINVAFTIDNNYPIYTMLAINSILLNNYSNSNFHFYIVEDNLTDKNKQKMTNILKKLMKDKEFKSDINFINIDTTIADQGKYLFGFSNRITPIAIARIFLPELLDIDRVIYLDGDILVTTDLLDLYNTNLGPYIAGMSPNINSNASEKLYTFKNGYYNSGMILMDLNKCRKWKSTEKMLNYLHNNIDKFIYKKDLAEEKKFLYPDQDLINIVWDGKIKRLDKKWNNQTIYGKILVNLDETGGTIVHYLGPIKPWHFKKPYYPPVKMYTSYWKECPTLALYRYYYVSLMFIDNYKSTLKIKFKRYKTFLRNIFNFSKEKHLLDLFTI